MRPSLLTMFKIYRSVLPRCLGWVSLVGALGGITEGIGLVVGGYGFWTHPNTLQYLAAVLGFALVMRIQIAYSRFWEAATNSYQASTRWADACMQIFAFDEISKDAWSDEAFAFRLQFLHWASLMHACHLVDLRQDDVHGPGMPTLSRIDRYVYRQHLSRNGGPVGNGCPTILLASSGFASAPELTGSSTMRDTTMLLQALPRARKALNQEQRQGEIHSFAFTDTTEHALFSTAIEAGRTAQQQQPAAARAREDALPRTRRVSRCQYILSVIFDCGSAHTERELAISNSLEVLGGVSESEVEMLQAVPPGDRTFRVQSWLVRLMTDRMRVGGLNVAAPILSRTYQGMSEGMTAAEQARKTSCVEFPFALRQLIELLLIVFSVLLPMCVSAFVDSVGVVVSVSFFAVLGYVALNETARDLETPFGRAAHGLSTSRWQKDFNTKLASMLDLSVPVPGYGSASSLIGVATPPNLSSMPLRRPRTASASTPAAPSALITLEC
jgi:predicted membrane chloride channel (bestrophin family)